MATYDDKWFEVWYSEGDDVLPCHLLVATPNSENRSRVLIMSPCEGNKVVFEGKDYEEARLWLLEDEYTQVVGREFPDDGW